jgi:ribosomal protein L20A (L18A)
VTEWLTEVVNNPDIKVSWKDGAGFGYKASTTASPTVGRITGTIVLTDTTKVTTTKQEIAIGADAFKIPAKTSQTAVATAIENALNEKFATVTNDTTVAEIKAEAEKQLNNDNLYVEAELAQAGNSKATYIAAGQLSVVVTVKAKSADAEDLAIDSTYNKTGSNSTVNFSQSISVLTVSSLSTAETAVNQKLKQIADSNFATGISGTANAANVLKAVNDLLPDNYSAAYKKDASNQDMATVTKASSATSDGTLTCTIIVTAPNGLTTTVSFNQTTKYAQ